MAVALALTRFCRCEWQVVKPAGKRLPWPPFPMLHRSLLLGEHTTIPAHYTWHHWSCAFLFQWLEQLNLLTLPLPISPVG
eukprot:Em0022g754a